MIPSVASIRGAVLFAALAAGSSLASAGCSETKEASAAVCTSGKDCLPEVNYVDTNGRSYTKLELAHKVVVVNFWATWCHPCQKEIPDLSKSYDKYKDRDVVFLGVMTDNPDNAALLNFQSDYNMTYPVVRANSDILVSYNYPDALPTTFVFDRGGKQVFKKTGGVSEAKLDSVLEPLIAQK